MSRVRGRAWPVREDGGRDELSPTAVRGPFPRCAWVPVTCIVLFVALTGLVVSGVAQSLDDRIISEVRPNDAWGEAQVRYSPWMHWLRPTRMFLLLAGTCVALSVWRRSWRPLVTGLVTGSVSVALVILAKVAVHRPDPHGALPPSGGSYPSGHIVAVLVCLVGCLVASGPRVHWWWWALPAAGAGLMSAALVVSAAHWPSDVLGGGLLALAVVTAARGSAGPRRPR